MLDLKKRKSFYLPESTLIKLEAYEKESRINASVITELAIESYILNKKGVEIEDMTSKEAKVKYYELIDKKQQIEEQIQRVYLRLED